MWVALRLHTIHKTQYESRTASNRANVEFGGVGKPMCNPNFRPQVTNLTKHAGFWLAFILMLVMAGTAVQPAAAQGPSVRIVGGPSVSNTCQALGFLMTINVAPDPAWSARGTLSVDGVGEVFNFLQNLDGSLTGDQLYGVVPSTYSVPAGTTITFTITAYNDINGGGGASSSDSRSWDCASGASSGGSSDPNVFRGPGLPGPGQRNLVIINQAVGVQTAPDGKQTGAVLQPCQTVFIVDTSADGKFGKIFVMGGWISLDATQDIPENYGQPGGTPVRPDCVGK
jgi:hypothetical protein